MLMFLDDGEIQKLERELKLLNDRGLPFATLEALNKSVQTARNRIRGDLSRKFEIRNRWTVGSIQYRNARGLVIADQAAEVGSMAEYMAEQEEGFTRRAKGKHGVPIPTPFAGGQGNAPKRTRVVRKAMRLGSIRLPRLRDAGMSRKERNVVAMKEAIRTKKRFVFLNTPGSKGLYKVKGGRKSKKDISLKGVKLDLVWSLERKTVRTRAHSWLHYQSVKTEKLLPEFYRRALERQVGRIKRPFG